MVLYEGINAIRYYMEQLAYTRYLCGFSNEFYKEEMRIHNIKSPQLAVLQKECDKVILASKYITDFGLKSYQIVNQLRNNIMLSDTLNEQNNNGGM